MKRSKGFRQRERLHPIERACVLLDEQRHPIGSFTPSHYKEVKEILDFVKWEKLNDAESVNVSFALLERLVQDLVMHDDVQLRWVFQPAYFRKLFHIWKEASVRSRHVVSPIDLVKKLGAMANQLPGLRYHPSTIGVLMDAVIMNEHPRKAPFAAEEFLDFVRNEAAKTRNADLQLNAYVYSQVLHAWSKSFSPDAVDKMGALVQTMQNEGIAPTEVTFNIILRSLGRQGAVDKIEAILETMNIKGVKPTIMTLAQASHGFSQAGMTLRAEQLIRDMEALEPRDVREINLLGESVQNLLLAYRAVVASDTASREMKETAVKRAEELFKHTEKQAIVTIESQGKCLVPVALHSRGMPLQPSLRTLTFSLYR